MRARTWNKALLAAMSLLLAACGGGGGGSDSSGAGNNNDSTNQAPTASIASAPTAMGTETVALNGSGSDADGSVASYAWEQTAGTSVTVINPADSTAQFVVPPIIEDETFTFRLTVTDNDGATATATITVDAISARRVEFAPSRDFSMAVTQPLRVIAFVYDEHNVLIVPTYDEPLVLEWDSSTPAVASVTALGYVEALSEGATDITATWLDPDNITRSSTVTVTVDGSLPYWTYFEHDDVTLQTPAPDIGGYPSDIMVARHGKTTGGVYESEVDCPGGWELVYDDTLIHVTMPDSGLPRQAKLDFALDVTDEQIDGGWTVLEAYCGSHAMSPLYVGTWQRRSLYYTWTYVDAVYDTTFRTRLVLDGDKVFAAGIGAVPVSPWPSVEFEPIFIDFSGSEAVVEKLPFEYAWYTALAVDPLNPGRPLMCGKTVGVGNVRCWHKDTQGDWQVQTLNAGYQYGVFDIAMTDEGKAYFLVTDAYGSNNPALAVSTLATRDDWVVTALNMTPPAGYEGPIDFLAMDTGPDDEPRMLLTFRLAGTSDQEIFYASRSSGGAWSFEKIIDYPLTYIGGFPELEVGDDNRVRAVFGRDYDQMLAVRENGAWSLDTVYTYNDSNRPNPNQPVGMTYGFGKRPGYFNTDDWISYSDLPLDGAAGHWYDEQVAISSFTGLVGIVAGVARDESNRVHVLVDSDHYGLTYHVLPAPPSYFEPGVVAQPESNTVATP